jgi:hypothetical protein
MALLCETGRKFRKFNLHRFHQILEQMFSIYFLITLQESNKEVINMNRTLKGWPFESFSTRDTPGICGGGEGAGPGNTG